MANIEPLGFDMKVRSITKVSREKDGESVTTYKLLARDADGINELTIMSGHAFPGITTHDCIINVKIVTSQKPLSDFVMPDKPKGKKAASMKDC